MTPAEEVSVEGKVDQLLQTADDVRHALNRRTVAVVVAIFFPLVVGAVLLWTQNSATRNNQAIAQRAYVQALHNNLDNLIAREQFALTRDCPVFYLRDLLAASIERRDFREVQPACEPIDTAGIRAQIAEVERLIAREERKSL